MHIVRAEEREKSEMRRGRDSLALLVPANEGDKQGEREKRGFSQGEVMLSD